MSKDWIPGRKCKFYANTGTHATPVWVEIKRAMDVNVDGLEKNEINVQDRSSEWEAGGGGAKKVAVSFGYLYKPGTDTVFDLLLDSFLNDTQYEFAVLDGDVSTSGSKGIRFFGIVFSFPYSQELEAGQKLDVKVSLAREEEGGNLVDPDWYEVP